MCGGGGPDTIHATTSSEPPSYLAGPMSRAAGFAEQQFLTQMGWDPYSHPGGEPLPPGQGTGYTKYQPGDMPGMQNSDVPTIDENGNPLDPNTGQPGYQPATGDELGWDTPPNTYYTDTYGQLAPNSSPGAGLIQQSQSQLSDILGGKYLDPSTNPWLMQSFNAAADATRGRLDSEFAGSGRNLGATMPARAYDLQTLANQMFGGNYDRERGIQVAGMDASQNLDPTNILLNRIAGLTPGAGGTTQSTQPVYQTGLLG